MRESLPPATAALWQRLEAEPALGGFYLLGGTALSLRIGHRLSEDLDLAWPAPRLPRARIDALVQSLESSGWAMQRHDSPAAYEEFLNSGMDLHDYQQDYIASAGPGAVKVSLFVPSGLHSLLLEPTEARTVLVADLPLLFNTKALVTSDRSTTRDWFDLYVLMTRHGFTIEDYAAAYGVEGRQNLDLGLARLTSGSPRPNDPGFESLLPERPTLDEITGFFRDEIRSWKLAIAERRLRERIDADQGTG